MFEINNNSNKPVYLQIVDQTKEAILIGLMDDGDKMPSIRNLAKTLLVNQSTVTKAYGELESQGIINTVPGIGTFISLDQNRMDLERGQVIDELKDTIKEAIFYGVELDEIIAIYNEVEANNDIKD